MKYRKSALQIEKYHSVKWLRSNDSKASFPKRFKVKRADLADAEEKIKGKVVYPWTKGYDDDRADFNNVYEAAPLMIVYVACNEDVRITLAFATENKIELVIRAGGHSLADYSVCDGIILDVSVLNNIYVDNITKTALIESGCTFEKIFPALEHYNLHVPGGGCPTVAIAGFMQGGGYGLTSRAFGMNCDCVIEVTVMLANGQIVVANKDKNRDLLWAVCGGTGGNFGVLLSVKYQLVSLGEMMGLKAKWVIDKIPDNAALALYTIQEKYLKEKAYPNLGIETVLTTDSDGLLKVMFCASWIGTQAAFEKALEPLKKIAGAAFGKLVKGKYSHVNTAVLDGTPNLPDNVKAYSRSLYIERSLSVSEWKNILTYFLTAPNKYTMVDMECYGGKIDEVKEGANAFIHRNVKMDFFCDAFFNKETNDQKKNEEWLEAFYKFLAPYSNGQSYQNYPNRKQKDFRQAYWGKYYNQLVAIKKKYDPLNFFNYQQSIGPDPIADKDQKIIFKKSNPIKYEKY